ncbi:MAG: fibronectin type III domain-containing protein, partial [Gammaproteobacteria bacterium]
RRVMRRLAAAFACIAMLGALSAHAQPTAPANPMLTQTIGAEASSLDFSWEAADHADGIGGYIVHLSGDDFNFSRNEAQNSLPPSASITGLDIIFLRVGKAVSAGTSLKFTGLQPATTFKARIRAYNLGANPQNGAWSAVVRAATANGPPGPPTFREAPLLGHKSVTLSWNAPNDGGALITGYKARWSLQSARGMYLNPAGAAGEDIPGGASVRMHTFTGLINQEAYLLEFAAVNTHGTGSWLGAQGIPELASGAVCLGNAAIPDRDACAAAADAGYILSKNLSGAQPIVVTAVQVKHPSLPVAVFTLKTTDGDNAIQANTDIEGSLPALHGATLTTAGGGGAVSATFSLTPKASGDGGSLHIEYTLTASDANIDSVTDTAFIGTSLTLASAGIRITAANADGACPAAHNAAVTAFTLTEGGDATGLCVSLAADPSANTPISCAVGNADLITVTPADLTFTSANWRTAQPLSVRAPDNNRAVAADSTDTLTCRGATGDYANATVNASITITDTDMLAATGALTATATIRENAGAQTVTITATLDAGATPSEACRVDVDFGGSIGAGEVMAVNGVDFRLPSLFPAITIPAGALTGSISFIVEPIQDDDDAAEVMSFLAEPANCSGTAAIIFGEVDIRIVEFIFGMLDGVAGATYKDGILVARYLAGARGADLTAGLGLADEVAAIAGADIGGSLHLLDVDGVNGTTMADGIMIARYHLGVVSGAGLTDGQADASKEATVTDNIVNLP